MEIKLPPPKGGRGRRDRWQFVPEKEKIVFVEPVWGGGKRPPPIV